jgi:hypothetical protein
MVCFRGLGARPGRVTRLLESVGTSMGKLTDGRTISNVLQRGQ